MMLSTIRLGLYGALGVISFVLMALSAARLQYTTHLPKGDTLNDGVDFYDPIAAELLTTSLFSIGWALFVIRVIHGRLELRIIGSFLGEFVGLAFLFLLWIVGAGVSSTNWSNLSFCVQYNPCRLLMALLAFAWLGWLVVLALLVLNLLFSFANKAWFEPMHGRWDPRTSQYQA
jgi:hypothetical protein